ncbi:MAG: transposase, partial [Magnetococcus sp. WYHC-3]
VIETQTGSGWSLNRVREPLLKVGARILVHGRRVIVVISGTAVGLLQAVWRGFQRFRPKVNSRERAQPFHTITSWL